jgi:hypothetical protein
LFEIAHGIRLIFAAAGYRLNDVDLFLATTDTFAAIIFIAIALFANRNYPLWIAAMQVLAMTAHLARGLAETISPIAYITMVVAPGWFQLLFLALGLLGHILRKRSHGEYRDWRTNGKTQPYGPASPSTKLFKAFLGQRQDSWRDELK